LSIPGRTRSRSWGSGQHARRGRTGWRGDISRPVLGGRCDTTERRVHLRPDPASRGGGGGGGGVISSTAPAAHWEPAAGPPIRDPRLRKPPGGGVRCITERPGADHPGCDIPARGRGTALADDRCCGLPRMSADFGAERDGRALARPKENCLSGGGHASVPAKVPPPLGARTNPPEIPLWSALAHRFRAGRAPSSPRRADSICLERPAAKTPISVGPPRVRENCQRGSICLRLARKTVCGSPEPKSPRRKTTKARCRDMSWNSSHVRIMLAATCRGGPWSSTGGGRDRRARRGGI